MADYPEVLRSVELLEDMDDASLAEVVAAGEELVVPGDGAVCHSGDVGTHFYIVLEGCVRVVLPTERRKPLLGIASQPGERPSGYTGRDRRSKTTIAEDSEVLPLIILKTHFPGGFFGEMSLLTGDPVSADVIAMEETRLLRFTKQVFESIFVRNPTVLLRLNRILSRYISSTNVMMSNPPSAKLSVVHRIGEGLQNCLATLCIALSVTRQTNRRVVLVDFESILGGFLSRFAPQSKLDAFRVFDLHRTFATQNEFSSHCIILGERLHVLTFPKPMSRVTGIEWSSLRRLITVICRFYDVVIVDGGNSPNRMFNELAALADRIYLLAVNERGHGAVKQAVKEFGISPLRGGKRLRIGLVGDFDFARPNHVLAPLVEATGIKNVFLLASDEVKEARMSANVLPVMDQNSPTGRRIGSIAREIAGCRIGVALGSGGAKGFAHIGVWQVIEELRIPVDAIVGCSMGAVIGASFAMGRNSQETEKLMRRLWTGRGAFFDWQVPPRSNIIKGRKVDRMADEAYEGKSILDCIVPYASLAFDLISGQEIVIDEGTIKNAVRASGSMPIILRPVKWKNFYLIDGGVTNKVPVDVLAGMGTDFNIAVNVAPEIDHTFYDPQKNKTPGFKGTIKDIARGMREMSAEPDMFKILSRWYSTSSSKITEAHLHLAQVVIRPNTEGVSVLDWRKIDEAIDVGRACARQHEGEIQSKLSSLRGF